MCGMVEKVQLAAILQALQLCVAAFRLVCRLFCFNVASYTKIIKLFFFFCQQPKTIFGKLHKSGSVCITFSDSSIAPGRSVPFGK